MKAELNYNARCNDDINLPWNCCGGSLGFGRGSIVKICGSWIFCCRVLSSTCCLFGGTNSVYVELGDEVTTGWGDPCICGYSATDGCTWLTGDNCGWCGDCCANHWADSLTVVVPAYQWFFLFQISFAFKLSCYRQRQSSAAVRYWVFQRMISIWP